MTYTTEHMNRIMEARETGTAAGREYQCLRDDLSWDHDTWLELLQDIAQNPWAPGTYTDPVTDSEAKHLARVWELHFDAGKHAQQAESARTNTTNRSAA